MAAALPIQGQPDTSQEAIPVAETPHTVIRQYVGKPIRLFLSGGPTLEGYLLSFDGRSLWVVVDGEDRFVPLTQVESVANPLPVAG